MNTLKRTINVCARMHSNPTRIGDNARKDYIHNCNIFAGSWWSEAMDYVRELEKPKTNTWATTNFVFDGGAL